MSKTSYYLITTLLLTTVGLSACSADSGTEANPESKNETSAISGFWERLPERENWERYLHIDQLGNVQSYERWRECWLAKSFGTFIHLEDNRYFYRYEENKYYFQYFAEVFIDVTGRLIILMEENSFTEKMPENELVRIADGDSVEIISGLPTSNSLTVIDSQMDEEGACVIKEIPYFSETSSADQIITHIIERGFLSGLVETTAEEEAEVLEAEQAAMEQEQAAAEVALAELAAMEQAEAEDEALAAMALAEAEASEDENDIPPPLPLPPAIPTNLNVEAGSQSILVTWDEVPDATSYTLFWNTVPTQAKYKNAEQEDQRVDGVTNPFVHTGLTAGQAYYYRVAAFNEGGSRGLSAETSATPNP